MPPRRPHRRRPPSPWITPPWLAALPAAPPPWRRPLILLWAFLVCCVTCGSLLPSSSPVLAELSRLHVSDKVLHGTAYFVLALLPVVAAQRWQPGVLAGFAMFLLGVLLEVAQHFSPGRAPDPADALANGLGVAAGLVLGILIRRFESAFIRVHPCP